MSASVGGLRRRKRGRERDEGKKDEKGKRTRANRYTIQPFEVVLTAKRLI
jgi:hypothetical protein